MTWTKFWNGIGDFCLSCFEYMPVIGNKFNYLLWVIIFVLLMFWITRIIAQNKEAKRNGTLQ